jgi:hypothetical protein
MMYTPEGDTYYGQHSDFINMKQFCDLRLCYIQTCSLKCMMNALTVNKHFVWGPACLEFVILFFMFRNMKSLSSYSGHRRSTLFGGTH